MRTPLYIFAAVFAVVLSIGRTELRADTFGIGTNAFVIDFVNVRDESNPADVTGYGAVPYIYRIGTYEISENQVSWATASGLLNVVAGAWEGDQPAGRLSWYEAAAFVNWLNTSTGRQAAYDLTWDGSSWSMALWSSTDAWVLGGTNLYRHKDAHYFLPSEDEWYKAAFYNPAGTNYFVYATGSDTPPTPVSGGTNAGTAVYGDVSAFFPAAISDAGGLSPYGTMGQSGNSWEWTESAFDGTNSDPSLERTFRGGAHGTPEFLVVFLSSNGRGVHDPADDVIGAFGFRVASVPEPSATALIAFGSLCLLLIARFWRSHGWSPRKPWRSATSVRDTQ